ncbi:MAG: hypothetical protein SFY70_05215 [Bacteroidia bacterium]|nr:hypothetical protein [Bacteroidia bacterium]
MARVLLGLLWALPAAGLWARPPDTLTVAQAQARGIAARVHWSQAKIDLGRATVAYLAVDYPSGYTLRWPDTLTGYPGFEWVRQQADSRQAGPQRHDSLRVWLRTWEVTPVQRLAPVLVLARADSQFVLIATPDSVAFASRVPDYRPTLPLLPDYALLPITRPVDWARVALLGGGVLVVLSLAAWASYRPVRRWWQRRVLRRRYQALVARVQAAHTYAETEPLAALSTINRLWKVWVDETWGLALPTRTAREMSSLLSDRADLSPDERRLLYDWVRTEESLNYAREPLPPAWWAGAYNGLLQFLESRLAAQLAAIR